jgi:hypothetical protein
MKGTRLKQAQVKKNSIALVKPNGSILPVLILCGEGFNFRSDLILKKRGENEYTNYNNKKLGN